MAWRSRRASTYFLIGVAALSAGGTFYLWNRQEAKRTAFVAGTDLSPYHQLQAGDFRKTLVPGARLRERRATEPSQLAGRYVVTTVRQGQVISLNDLGPALPADTLRDRRLVALPATTADLGGGLVSRGDRVDLLLSSTQAESPRNAILHDVVVLDAKPTADRPGTYTVIYAVRRTDEPALLTAGGTARVFIVRDT